MGISNALAITTHAKNGTLSIQEHADSGEIRFPGLEKHEKRLEE